MQPQGPKLKTRKFRDETGKIYYANFDETGNQYGEAWEDVPSQGFSLWDKPKSVNIGDVKKRSQDVLGTALTGLGTTGGALLGTAAGAGSPLSIPLAFGGALTGNQLAQRVQGMAPEWLGQPSGDQSALINAGLETLLGPIPKSPIVQKAVKWGMNKGADALRIARNPIDHFLLSHAQVNPEEALRITKAVDADPGFPLTAGQASENPFLNLMEGTALRGKKGIFDAAQRQHLKQSANQFISQYAKRPVTDFLQETTTEMMKKAPQAVKDAYTLVRGQESTLHNMASQAVKNYKIHGVNPATSANTEIEGPIFLDNTAKFAEKVYRDLSRKIAKSIEQGFENPTLTKYYQELQKNLEPFITAAVDPLTGKRVIDYELAKDFKGKIYNLLRSAKEGTPYAGELDALGGLMAKDMRKSVSGWTDPVAKDLVTRARNKTLERVGRFNNAATKNFQDVIENVDADVVSVAKEVFDAGETEIKNYMKAGVNPAEKTKLAQPLKAEAARKILTTAWNTEEKKFIPGKAFDLLQELRPKLKILGVTGDEVNQIEFLLDRMRIAQQGRVPGETSFTLGKARAVAFLSGNLFRSLLAVGAGSKFGGLSGAAIGAGIYLGAIKMANNFEHKFFDRTFTRKLADLAVTSPGTPKADELTKWFLRSMNGARILVQNAALAKNDPNFEGGQEFTIRDGKLVP